VPKEPLQAAKSTSESARRVDSATSEVDLTDRAVIECEPQSVVADHRDCGHVVQDLMGAILTPGARSGGP
jgi:hypothetical protein